MNSVLYIKVLLILLVSCAISRAQGISNFWLSGYNCGGSQLCGGSNINFFSGIPATAKANRSMNFFRTNSTISSSSGSLLFYTNGIFIANALGDTMLNGENLCPGFYTGMWENSGLPLPQASLILPIPGDTTRYYLFHETIEDIGQGIYQPIELVYTEIDMTLDGGLGGVVFKNRPIISDTLLISGITACKHANGRDWWIITHRYDSDIYLTLLLTPYGISGPFTQHAGPYIYDGGGDQSVFSPDGKRFVRYQIDDDLDIFDFDRCTGLLSNPIHIAIDDSASGGGVAISPNSKFLYVSSANYVYQYDLSDTNVASTQTTVAVFDGFSDPIPPFYTTFYLSQLAPDNKIYINTGNGSHYLHVINKPDSAGLACNLIQHSFVLPTYNKATIPNYPNYFLGADTASICDTINLIENNFVNNTPHEIMLFPNPTLNRLYVKSSFGLLEISTLVIYNMFGEEIKYNAITNRESIIEINIESIPSGIYILTLKSDNSFIARRFIKK